MCLVIAGLTYCVDIHIYRHSKTSAQKSGPFVFVFWYRVHRQHE